MSGRWLTAPPPRAAGCRGRGSARRARSAGPPRAAARARAGAAPRARRRRRAASGSSIARCRMIGPVSTPSSTKWTVTPKTFTPYSSACSIARTPGKAGSSAGWTLMTRLREARRGSRRRAAACSRRARPARPRARASQSAIAASRAARSASWSASVNTAVVHAGRLGARPERPRPGSSEPTRDDLDAVAAVDLVEQRLEVGARAGDEDPDPQRRSRGLELRERARPWSAARPSPSSASTRASTVVAAQVREGAVGRQPVVGVARATTFERPPRRISTARVRPTEGSALTTTSMIAASRSSAARRTRRGAAPGAPARRGHDASGSQTSQQGTRGAGSERSPKWRRIACAGGSRRPRRRPTPRGTGASGCAAPRWPRRGRRRAPGRRSRPTSRPTARSSADGAGWSTPACTRCPTIARSCSSSICAASQSSRASTS